MKNIFNIIQKRNLSNLALKNFCKKVKVDQKATKHPQNLRDTSLFKDQDQNKPSKAFEKKLNSVEEGIEGEEQVQSLDSYLKVLKEKMYKQNNELTTKIEEIFKTEQGSNETKLFACLSEVNKHNINNISELLTVFLDQVLKYNDSVRLFIQHAEKKKNKYSYLIPFLALTVGLSCLIYLKKELKYFNYKNLATNFIDQYYANQTSLFGSSSSIPIYSDHKNISNLINFSSSDNILIIGPRGIGKTESLKHFVLSENQNRSSLVVYLNMDAIDSSSNDIEDFIFRSLNNKNEPISEEILKSETFRNEVYFDIEDRKAIVVFDNYNHERDSYLIRNNLKKLNNLKFKTIISTDTNEIYEDALLNNISIKYVPLTQTGKFKTYLLDFINSFIKKRIEFSNVESLTEEAVQRLYDIYPVLSFNHIAKYLENKNTIENFKIKQKEEIEKKLNLLKIKHPNAYSLYRTLVGIAKIGQWNNLPQSVNYQDVIRLEKLGFVLTKNFNEYVILENISKELIHKK